MGRAFNSNGQPITPTGTTNRIGRADFEAYRQRRAIEQQQKAQHNIRSQVLDISKLPQQSAYNQLNQARQAGIISKEEHLAKIKEINAREQSKLKEDMKVTPMKVAGETAKNTWNLTRSVQQAILRTPETVFRSTMLEPLVGNATRTDKNAISTASAPHTGVWGEIYGKDPVQSYQEQARDIGVAAKQSKNKTVQGLSKYSPFISPLMAALDLAGTGSVSLPLAKKVVEKVAKSGAKTALEQSIKESSQKVLSSKPSQYLFGDKTAVQEAVAKAKAPKAVETPKVEPTVAEKPITPPKKIEVTTPQVTKTRPTYKDEMGVTVSDIKVGEETIKGVDAGIAKPLEDINNAGYKTFQSMSGLKSDYTGKASERYSADGYMAFLKKDNTPEKMARIEAAAKKAGLEFQPDKSTFNIPSSIVRTGVTKDGSSIADLLQEAGKTTTNKSGEFVYTKESYDARQKLWKELIEKHGGQISDSEIAKRWKIFSDELSGAKTPVGEQRVTGGAKTAEVEKTAGKVYERMKAEHPEVFTDETSREVRALKEEADTAVKIVAKDKQKAFNIAMGAETSPDVTSTATNIALVEQSLKEGKHDLANRLLRSRSIAQKRRGQEISAERLATDNSRTRYMQDLLDMKLKKYGEKYLGDLETKVKKITPTQRALKKLDDDVAKMETKIKTKKLTVDDALGLLEKMACI